MMEPLSVCYCNFTELSHGNDSLTCCTAQSCYIMFSQLTHPKPLKSHTVKGLLKCNSFTNIQLSEAAISINDKIK